jgi:hypothetical protein
MFPPVDPAAGVAAAPNAEPPPPPKMLGAPVFPVLLRLKADMARSKGLRPKTRRRARPRQVQGHVLLDFVPLPVIDSTLGGSSLVHQDVERVRSRNMGYISTSLMIA